MRNIPPRLIAPKQEDLASLQREKHELQEQAHFHDQVSTGAALTTLGSIAFVSGAFGSVSPLLAMAGGITGGVAALASIRHNHLSQVADQQWHELSGRQLDLIHGETTTPPAESASPEARNPKGLS